MPTFSGAEGQGGSKEIEALRGGIAGKRERISALRLNRGREEKLCQVALFLGFAWPMCFRKQQT